MMSQTVPVMTASRALDDEAREKNLTIRMVKMDGTHMVKD